MNDNYSDFGPPEAPAPVPAPQPRPSVAKLALALAKAQGKIAAPIKNREVDFTNNKGQRVKYAYADLADVIDCIRAALSENELAVVHRLEYLSAGRYGMLTELLHSSGEAISTWYPLPDPGQSQMKAQEFGSALTYARRYSLSALLGIASEEDDDGAAAAPAKPAARQPAPVIAPKPTDPEPLNQAQLARLFAIADDCTWSKDQVKGYMEARWGISTTRDLTRERYDGLVDVIRSRTYQEACAGILNAPRIP